MKKILLNLQLFAWSEGQAGTPTVNPVNITTQASMSPTIKPFIDTYLLENAREKSIFTQLGKQEAMHGNEIEWRKFNTFAKALTPLQEGVIPSGQTFGMTSIKGTITQHGDYTVLTDRLTREAFDNVVVGATEEMGAAMGETYDTLTRNILVAGNSVMYCPNGDAVIDSRSNITNDCKLTPDMVKKAATWLKKNKAPTIDGYYVAVIHPSVVYDLRGKEWEEYQKYTNSTPIFKGEIGELHGVKFIESTNAKVWKDGDFCVYATLFLGKDAFGVLKPDGEGAEMIVKSEAEIGGPINQFSTIGYKFCHGAKILYQERMLRVESGSSFGSDDEAN